MKTANKKQSLLDSDGKLPLGKDFANKENWCLFYDLNRKNQFLLVAVETAKRDWIKAYIGPALNFDEEGRFPVPQQFERYFDRARLINEGDLIIITYG